MYLFILIYSCYIIYLVLNKNKQLNIPRFKLAQTCNCKNHYGTIGSVTNVQVDFLCNY